MMFECLCQPPQFMYKNLSPCGMKSWSFFVQRPFGRLFGHKGRAHEWMYLSERSWGGGRTQSSGYLWMTRPTLTYHEICLYLGLTLSSFQVCKKWTSTIYKLLSLWNFVIAAMNKAKKLVNWKCSKIYVFKLSPKIYQIYKGINDVEFIKFLTSKNHQYN